MSRIIIEGVIPMKTQQNIQYFPKGRRRKRRNESDREYIFRKSHYRCRYCRKTKRENELHAVRKHPEKRLPLIYDGVCSCGKCAKEKGSMTHREYLDFLAEEKSSRLSEIEQNKKKIRQVALKKAKVLNRIIFEKYDYTCIYCKHEFGYMKEGHSLTKDHKIPVSRGGTNDLDNLACSCFMHNNDKGARTASEYLEVIRKRRKRQSEQLIQRMESRSSH